MLHLGGRESESGVTGGLSQGLITEREERGEKIDGGVRSKGIKREAGPSGGRETNGEVSLKQI